jgi:hypothetical protein
MLIKRFLLICSLPAFLSGCAEFYGSQPPAPVYGSESTVASPSLPKPKAPKPIVPEPIDQDSNEIVKTEPLKEFVPITTPLEELKSEQPLMPEQESLAPEQEALSTEQDSSLPAQEPSQEPAITAPSQEFVAPQPPPPPPPPPFEPLESFAPLSPAVGALALAANQNSKSGNIESATTTIERAIRIEPRNATLYYKLALLRLKQSKPRLAEDLAKKAALLASNDTQLKKHSWLLVARAREVQGDVKGGKEARAMADKF